MQGLCILCGKREFLYNNLCENCFRARTKLLEVPDSFSIVRCGHCNSILIGKKWIKFDNFNEAVAKIAEKKIEWHELSKERKTNLKFENNAISELKILANATILGLKFQEAKSAKIKLQKATCTTCSKKFGGYYESIVQIRSEVGKLTKERIEENLNLVKNIIESAHNPDIFLTKYESLPEGLDLYLSTTAIGKKIATSLAKKYNTKIKISRTLVTRRAGKNIYRVTFSVRIP